MTLKAYSFYWNFWIRSSRSNLLLFVLQEFILMTSSFGSSFISFVYLGPTVTHKNYVYSDKFFLSQPLLQWKKRGEGKFGKIYLS